MYSNPGKNGIRPWFTTSAPVRLSFRNAKTSVSGHSLTGYPSFWRHNDPTIPDSVVRAPAHVTANSAQTNFLHPAQHDSFPVDAISYLTAELRRLLVHGMHSWRRTHLRFWRRDAPQNFGLGRNTNLWERIANWAGSKWEYHRRGAGHFWRRSPQCDCVTGKSWNSGAEISSEWLCGNLHHYRSAARRIRSHNQQRKLRAF